MDPSASLGLSPIHSSLTSVIEVEVHQQLRQLLRQHPDMAWPHQLTMARMVARGLRLQRSALIQVPSSDHCRFSYLLPALMWSGPVLLCAPLATQTTLMSNEIPWIQEVLQVPKPVLQASTWPGSDFQGLLLMDPQAWLQYRLHTPDTFPTSIPLLLDSAEQLEGWVQATLTVTLDPIDWQRLQRSVPHLSDSISDCGVKLTRALLQRPLRKVLLYADELHQLQSLLTLLPPDPSYLPSNWLQFQRHVSQSRPFSDHIIWATVHHDTGQISLHSLPSDLSSYLQPIWSTQPFVIIGEALDIDREAATFRQRLGLPDLTTLRFLPDGPHHPERSLRSLQVYTPRLPIPNSPYFREHLLAELKRLICDTSGSIVILTSDQPLQTQVGTALAAEFGSRVRVNLPHPSDKGVLVCTWDYWLCNKAVLPVPTLLVIATLPFPSTEDPLVASRVEYMRHRHQDWFRAYLLPTAAAYLQRALTPLRDHQILSEDTHTFVAILDSRIITRSYGSQLLDALSPIVKTQRHPLLA